MVVLHNFIGCDVEGVPGGNCEVFVLRSVINLIFADELKRTVSSVSLEDADNSLGKGYAEFIGFGVPEFDLVSGFQVSLFIASSTDGEKVIFSDGDVVGLGDELDLLLRVFVDRDGLAQGIHVIVREGFLLKGRWSCSQTLCHHKHDR